MSLRLLQSSAWVVCLALAGCQRTESPQFVTVPKYGELSGELQSAVQTELVKYTGTFQQPRIVAEKDAAAVDLARGQAVYQERCVQCHGVSGDGAGPAAKYMYPKPRDYRRGLFKFISASYGHRPVREDLVRTVRQGIRGTSMPGFSLIHESDLQAVVDYVVMLSRRGELEEQLIDLAETEGTVEPELVQDDLVTTVLRRWNDAEENEVLPLKSAPKFTMAHVERGKQAFLTKGCSKCHGEDGRGQTLDNRGSDVWGHPTRAADLTSGMLHGGTRPLDIYRRIYSGINGTPMPSFANALRDEPDTIWDLVAYVLSVSSRRREGQSPAPGPIRPYVPVPVEPASKSGE